VAAAQLDLTPEQTFLRSVALHRGRKVSWQETAISSYRTRAREPLFLGAGFLTISLPGLNGLELQKQIAVKRADMPIILITGYGDVPKVQAMKTGLSNF
jgi:DNA-binding NtrC family response regulator